jgi:hypothetical protein
MTVPGAAFGLLVGSTNSAGSPVLPIRRGGLMFGAGICAASASLAMPDAAQRVAAEVLASIGAG